MAKKKVVEVASPVVETPAENTQHSTTLFPSKEELYAKLVGLVAQYNDSAEFSEFKVMKKLDGDISETLQKYTEACERECFSGLYHSDNIMRDAALQLTFETVGVKDEKLEEGGTERKIVSTDKRIDPLRLHKAVHDGIGKDKLWWAKIERLNALLIAATAKALDSVNESGKKIDLSEIKDTIAMSQEAAKLELANEEGYSSDEVILQTVQSILDAMLGDGYHANMAMVEYLRSKHVRGNSRVMTVVCSNAKTMREAMLDCCNHAITGTPFVTAYKKRKGK